MEYERRVRKRIFDYLLYDLPIAEFVDWFAQESQNAMAAAPLFDDLTGEVRLLLSEYARGDRDETSLRHELTRLSKSSLQNPDSGFMV